MTYDKKADANQPILVEYLRSLGYSVESLHRVGGGVPDLLVGGYMPCPHCGKSFPQNALVEVKKEHGKLNPKQLDWHGKWFGQKATARSEADIDDIIRRPGQAVIRYIGPDGRVYTETDKVARGG